MNVPFLQFPHRICFTLLDFVFYYCHLSIFLPSIYLSSISFINVVFPCGVYFTCFWYAFWNLGSYIFISLSKHTWHTWVKYTKCSKVCICSGREEATFGLRFQWRRATQPKTLSIGSHVVWLAQVNKKWCFCFCFCFCISPVSPWFLCKRSQWGEGTRGALTSSPVGGVTSPGPLILVPSVRWLMPRDHTSVWWRAASWPNGRCCCCK